MKEIQDSNLPILFSNYVELIKNRKSPYYDIVCFLLKDMELHYQKSGQGSETVYTSNPRILQEEIEKKVKNERLTTVNVCRTILATLHGTLEEKEWYVTTTSGGRRNYHVNVNDKNLHLMGRLL